jgi:hypothetical protein
MKSSALFGIPPCSGIEAYTPTHVLEKNNFLTNVRFGLRRESLDFRVTRLGVLSTFGRLFSLVIFLTITAYFRPKFFTYFFTVCFEFDEKWVGQYLGSFFTSSSGHPVGLPTCQTSLWHIIGQSFKSRTKSQSRRIWKTISFSFLKRPFCFVPGLPDFIGTICQNGG